eukprot:COSAG04_NODE_254_length_18809_cov_8.025869_7_plen_108_part_00
MRNQTTKDVSRGTIGARSESGLASGLDGGGAGAGVLGAPFVLCAAISLLPLALRAFLLRERLLQRLHSISFLLAAQRGRGPLALCGVGGRLRLLLRPPLARLRRGLR